MTDMNLQSLSYEELKEQARILGVPVKGNTETLRQNIQAALSGDVLEVAESKETLEPAKTNKKKDWKMIQIAEKDGETQPVFVGSNGRQVYVRRGEPVEVPPWVVEVLSHANQMVRARKPGTDNEWEWKSVPSYPFQVLS